MFSIPYISSGTVLISYIENFSEYKPLYKMIITAVLFSPYVACCVGLSKTTLFIGLKTDENIMRCKAGTSNEFCGMVTQID